MKKALIILFISSTLMGCSATMRDDSRATIETFQDLLNSGWRIQVVENKVILVKDSGEMLLINDVFGTLNP